MSIRSPALLLLLALVAAAPAWPQAALEGGGSEALRLAYEGAAALAAGDLEAAEARFRELSEREPDLPGGWLGLAEIRERRGDLVGALDLVRRARSKDSDDPAAAFFAGRLLARMGSTEEALAALEVARRLAPAAPEGHLLAALLLRDAGRLEEGLEVLREALATDAAAPELAEELSFQLLASGESREAAAVARKAIERHPERGALAVALGLALVAEAESETRVEAAEWLARGLELGAPRPDRVRLELGELLTELGRPREAIPHLEAAASSIASEPAAFYALGAARRAAGDSAGAAEALSRFAELRGETDAAESAAKRAGTMLNEARDLAERNRLGEALARIDEALPDYPDEARARILKSKVLYAQGRIEDALGEAVRARSLSEERTEAHYLEGLFLLRLGRLGEAGKAVERALVLEPDHGDAHGLAGMVASREERSDEAVEHYRRALELGADSPALRLGFAEALRSLGRTDESEAQMAHYRRLSGGDSGSGGAR